MGVDPFVARGFGDVADAYERARPGYPPQALAWLAERLQLGPGATVVDLGAGTGKLTRQLLETGARVIAVEPLESMRAVLARVVREAEALAGTAEAIPLPDRSVDAVTAGQAAHWFGPGVAAELARVLRPGGGAGFVWNVRDVDDPLQSGIDAVIAASRTLAPTEGWDRWREGLEHGPFTPLEETVFPHVHELAADDVPLLVSSFSYVGGLPAAEREAVLLRVSELVDASNRLLLGPEGPRVRLAYRTEAFACRRRRPASPGSTPPAR